MLPPCSGLSRRGLETPQSACMTERRPALTAPARGGVGDLRSGRKKACGAVEQKKGQKEGRVLEPHRALRTAGVCRTDRVDDRHRHHVCALGGSTRWSAGGFILV